MIQPKDVTITTQAGEEKTYIFSKFPATDGREIVAKYPLSGLPKIGDYGVNEETMLKLMAHVGIARPAGAPLMLTTKVLVNNHVPDWESLAKIEMGMLEYNCSFFENGKTSVFFAGIADNLKAWITSILMGLSAASSTPEKPRSTN